VIPGLVLLTPGAYLEDEVLIARRDPSGHWLVIDAVPVLGQRIIFDAHFHPAVLRSESRKKRGTRIRASVVDENNLIRLAKSLHDA
jgi:hypothetical protein